MNCLHTLPHDRRETSYTYDFEHFSSKMNNMYMHKVYLLIPIYNGVQIDVNNQMYTVNQCIL